MFEEYSVDGLENGDLEIIEAKTSAILEKEYGLRLILLGPFVVKKI